MQTFCLCRRAGKLIIGFDAVKDEMRKKTSGGVILTSDVSPKTEKEVLFHAEQNGIEVIKAEFTMDEAKHAIGKRAGVFFVTDEGLFGSIKKHTLN